MTRIEVTRAQVERLLADLDALPTVPQGEHLSDDDFVAYASETLGALELERVDAHLASCVACTAEMEQLLEAGEAWHGEPGDRRLAALRDRVRGAALREVLKHIVVGIVLPLGAGAKAATLIADGETPDHRLRWRIVKKEDGSTVIRFGSHELAFEGARLRVRAGRWQGDVALRRLAPDQLGAELRIPREAQPDIGDGRVEVVEDGS